MFYFGHTGCEVLLESAHWRPGRFPEERTLLLAQSVDSAVLCSGPLRLLATNMPAVTDLRKGLLSFLIHLVPSMGKTIP